MMALVIGKDRTPAVLRKLAKAEANPRVARRLLAIANALSGMSRKEAAEAAGMERQALRDAVVRYNAHGLDGLYDCWSNDARRGSMPASRRNSRSSWRVPIRRLTAFPLSRARIWCASAKRVMAVSVR